MKIPENLSYTKDHEWAVKDASNIVTIGITAFAVEQLGDITLVEMPDVSSDVQAAETVGTIESVKAVSDLYSPVSGTVTAVNSELEEAPEQVNEDPYGNGWILKVELSDPAEYDEMMDASAYQDYLDSLDD